MKIVRLLLIFLCSINALELQASFKFANRKAWAAACRKLPKNIDIKDGSKRQSAWTHHPEIGNNKTLAWQEFCKALTPTLHRAKDTELADQSLWVNQQPDSSFYNLTCQVFNPYVQKLDCTAEDKVILHGDKHGDIHSVIAELQDLENQGLLEKDSFKLTSKNIKLVYLGDYVDRGLYGSEVIYTLLRLKLANPDQVIMVRGNHEDPNISNKYGFRKELTETFGSDEEKYNQIYRLYNFLPVALYVGHNNNYLQCCHGGVEYGYQPQPLLNGKGKFHLLGTLQREKFKEHLENCSCCACKGSWQSHDAAFKNFTPKSPTENGESIGFMWFDFMKKGLSTWKKGRGLAANEELTEEVLAFQSKDSPKKVLGIMRAHQHAGERNASDSTNLMSELVASNGILKHWRKIETNQERSLTKGIAWTFNVSPDSTYGKGAAFGFATYAVLKMAPAYKDWKLKVHNVQVIHRPGYDKPISTKQSWF